MGVVPLMGLLDANEELAVEEFVSELGELGVDALD